MNEKEAAVVRRIFSEYLAGKGASLIAKGLMRDGILTARGNKKWTADAVQKILKNEKHCGNTVTSKTITVDYLSHKRIRNDGREQQYFIKNHHPAIISEEEWEAVQQELKRRNKMLRDPDGKYAQNYSNRSYFSNKLYCGECGHPVVRRRICSQKNGEKYHFTAWQCRTRIHPKIYVADCKARYIQESSLEEAFMKVLYDLKEEKDQVTSEVNEIIAEYDLSDMEKARLIIVEEQLDTINNRIHELTENRNSTIADVYEANIRHLYYEQEALQAELEDLYEKQEESKHLKKQLEELLKLLDELENARTFRADIFQQTANSGILSKDREVVFEFKCGISRKVEAQSK
nr:recombinase family protein [Heliorestis acidaminivorans]